MKRAIKIAAVLALSLAPFAVHAVKGLEGYPKVGDKVGPWTCRTVVYETPYSPYRSVLPPHISDPHVTTRRGARIRGSAAVVPMIIVEHAYGTPQETTDVECIVRTGDYLAP